jgi:hypothetical protein
VLQKDDHAMTAPSSIDPARFLDEQLAQASPDLLRSMSWRISDHHPLWSEFQVR